MPRDENSAAPGPQTRARRTTFSDRSRVQPDDAVLSLSDANIIEQQLQALCDDVRQTELRDRGVVEADQCVAWNLGEMRPCLDRGNTPGSSQAAHAGSCRGGAESDAAHNDNLQSAAGELHDTFDLVRGVDPNDSAARLEHVPSSMLDFSDELAPTLQETERGRME